MSESDPRDYRSLGDLLRDARQEKQVSLEQLNESTRISVRVLKALEQDDLEAAAGLVYVRGFVRTLALYYDLDPEWLGAKLDALAGETSRPVLPVDGDDDVIAGPVADPVPDEVPEDTGPKWEVESTRIRHVGAGSSPRVSRNLIYGLVAVLVLAIALVWWIGSNSGSGEGTTDGAPTASTELASLDEDPLPDTAEESLQLPPADGRTDPDPVQDSVEIPEAAATESEAVMPETEVARPDTETETGQERDDHSAAASARLPDTTEQDSPVKSSPEDPAPRRVVEVEDSVDSARTGLSSVLRPAESGAIPHMELRILADGPVEVTLSSDGARQEIRSMVQGEEWRLRGSDHFSLAVSDPAVVRLEIDGHARQLPLNWNGEEWILYPPRMDGGER